MNPRIIPCIFAILVIAMSLMAGCAEEEPVAAPPTPTPTPTPSPTPEPTPTLSPACQDLNSAADEDVAFLKFLSNNSMYTRVNALASTDCKLIAAAQRNEMISKGPKPKTPLLSDARKYLMSATTYCYEPETGTAKSRTRDDVESYIGKMSAYADLVYSCTETFDRDTSTRLENSLDVNGAKVFRGSENSVNVFNVKHEGKRIISMTYDGQTNFSVSLKKVGGNTTKLHESFARPWAGTATQNLESQNYELLVTAEGPWRISTYLP